MEGNVIIDIAGIRLSVAGDGPVAGHGFAPSYASFLAPAEAADQKPADMTIRLIEKEIPAIENAHRKFDSHDAWTLFEDQVYFHILFHPPKLEVPLWMARVDREFSETTIYLPGLTDREVGETDYHPLCYPLDQILLMNMLLKRHSALVHSACVEINNETCIFPGVSGAGKSTLSRQLRARENMTVLSDDRTIVKQFDDHYMAYGTPWPGEEGIARNSGGPLKGIFFIHHSDITRAERITHKEALKRLFPTISVPWYDAGAVAGMLDTCTHLVDSVPAYVFHVKPGPDVADILEEMLYG